MMIRDKMWKKDYFYLKDYMMITILKLIHFSATLNKYIYIYIYYNRFTNGPYSNLINFTTQINVINKYNIKNIIKKKFIFSYIIIDIKFVLLILIKVFFFIKKIIKIFIKIKI